MKKITNLLCLLISTMVTVSAQQSSDITFLHDGKTVFGTFTTPGGSGIFPTIIINSGSGPNDRDGTLPMVGGNVACLFPALLNDTLRPYKELSDALVDSGYAVLRYDKLEYTYPTQATLGTITFHKVSLPIESAIQYVKTRTDVDTNKIILLGHSEGSSIIPFIAKGRSDVKALISVAGARTPFDSLLAYQLVNIAQTCGGNVSQAQAQANQVLGYFNVIRTNTWNGSTPAAFGAPASTWYDYIRATDSVATNYNLANLPTLFTGMGLDINVPPAELLRLQSEVTITNDFWSMPGLIHDMTPNNDPHVSAVLTDTIIHWLRQHNLATGTRSLNAKGNSFFVLTNPVNDAISIQVNDNFPLITISMRNSLGQVVFRTQEANLKKGSTLSYRLKDLPSGIYFLELTSDNQCFRQEIVKQ